MSDCSYGSFPPIQQDISEEAKINFLDDLTVKTYGHIVGVITDSWLLRNNLTPENLEKYINHISDGLKKYVERK